MKGLKAILFTAFLGAGMTGSAPLFAQGYLSDMTGVNAVLSRDPARQASTEIDAVLTNPAGTAFLEDGFHFSLNGMFAFRDVDVKDRETPFLLGKQMKSGFCQPCSWLTRETGGRFPRHSLLKEDSGNGKATAVRLLMDG